MNLLAIDQAFEKSGWAAGTPDLGCVACGLIKVKGGRFTDLGGRFLSFEMEVLRLIDRHQPEIVIFEAHRSHAGVQAAQVLGAVSALVMKAAKVRGLPSYGIEVSAHKKHFTGCGRASKELTLAVARKKYPGLTIVDDNVADAISLLHSGFKLVEP